MKRWCRLTSRDHLDFLPEEPAVWGERMLAFWAAAHVESRRFADTLCHLVRPGSSRATLSSSVRTLSALEATMPPHFPGSECLLPTGPFRPTLAGAWVGFLDRHRTLRLCRLSTGFRCAFTRRPAPS